MKQEKFPKLLIAQSLIINVFTFVYILKVVTFVCPLYIMKKLPYNNENNI